MTVLTLLAFGAASTGTSAQQPPANMVQIAARALTFMNPPRGGPLVAAIVYEPGNAASERESRSLERALSPSVTVGALTLRPRRVASTSLDQLAGTSVAFVTSGTDYRRVASAAMPRAIVTIGSDPACARAGHCVMAITSGGRVQIIVSRTASTATRVRFNASFLMLIKEI